MSTNHPAPRVIPAFDTVFGVDFSGARLAGRNLWVARLEPYPDPLPPAHRLAELANLGRVAGTDERGPVLARLVRWVSESRRALWGMDFPFGLPVEVMPAGAGWPEQLAFVRDWGEDGYAAGVECLRRARLLGGPGHIRRRTDADTKAPFDPYHYRVIYQTFFGMRDVLLPLDADPATAVVPFRYGRLAGAERAVVEACPTSTLKRWRVPHHSYKQPEGGPLTARRRRNRRAILADLAGRVEFTPAQRLVMMRNGGGDALDAVIAAVGAAETWASADHGAIAGDGRYPREGHIFA